MLEFIATLVPVALAFALLALARDGEFAPRRMVQAVAAAVVAGPLAMALLGFAGWLLLVTLSVAALTAYAARRQQPSLGFSARE